MYLLNCYSKDIPTRSHSLDYLITETEIRTAAGKLKNNKSSFSDKIKNEMIKSSLNELMPVYPGGDLRGGGRGCAPPPPPGMTCGFLIQLVFCEKKKNYVVYSGVEVEQETSAPPPKKNPGSTPVI